MCGYPARLQRLGMQMLLAGILFGVGGFLLLLCFPVYEASPVGTPQNTGTAVFGLLLCGQGLGCAICGLSTFVTALTWAHRPKVVGTLLLGLLLPLAAQAEDARWADRPDLRFEDPAPLPAPAPPPPALPPPAPTPPPALFTRQTAARDTPELLLTYMNDPTDENGLEYIEWKEARAKALHTRAARLQVLWQKWRAAHPEEGKP